MVLDLKWAKCSQWCQVWTRSWSTSWTKTTLRPSTKASKHWRFLRSVRAWWLTSTTFSTCKPTTNKNTSSSWRTCQSKSIRASTRPKARPSLGLGTRRPWARALTKGRSTRDMGRARVTARSCSSRGSRRSRITLHRWWIRLSTQERLKEAKKPLLGRSRVQLKAKTSSIWCLYIKTQRTCQLPT